MGTHESTVVVRMPDDLKSRLKIEAKKLGVSVSELIRRKLLALEEEVGERRAMVRIGTDRFEIEEILRPEIISYENAPSMSRRRENVDHFSLPHEKTSRSKKWGGGLTEEAIDLLAATRKIATARFNDAVIMLEHLLVVLCQTPQTNARRLLDLFDVDAEGIVREIEDVMKVPGSSLHIGTIPISLAVSETLDRAREEVTNLGEPAAGTEHLLLAILGRSNSLASTSLTNEGMYYDDLFSVIRNRTD